MPRPTEVSAVVQTVAVDMESCATLFRFNGPAGFELLTIYDVGKEERPCKRISTCAFRHERLPRLASASRNALLAAVSDPRVLTPALIEHDLAGSETFPSQA